MKRRAPALTILLLMISRIPSFAQEVEMADGMRSNGMIYVVVVVILLVLVGLFVYLFALDKKLTRLEKKFEDNR